MILIGVFEKCGVGVFEFVVMDMKIRYGIIFNFLYFYGFDF